MAHYRVSELDLSTRVTLALELLAPIPARAWGRVTELAQRYGVSRTFLYNVRARAWEGLTASLLPGQPGPQPQATTLVIDPVFIQRAITLMPLLKGTLRDIQHGLRWLFGVERSLGYISQTLHAAGERAVAYNASLQAPLPILGEADEIFQGRQPCLTVVDGRSFLVVNLTPATHRDATTWGVTYLDLLAQGIQFQDLACDGATGLRAGVQAAQLAVPLRPDLFHLLWEAHRLTRRLEAAAYKAIQAAERARQADREARGLVRRRGPRLKHTLPLPQAQQEEAHAIARFDQWCWLLGEIRLALEPLTPAHTLVAAAQAQATLEAALALLKELAHAHITAFADNLQQQLPELLAPLAWLEQQLTPLLAHLDTSSQAFVVWAWQQRRALDLDIEADLPAPLRAVVHAVGACLELFHRSSSLAESLHSWLRPYLQIHRGMPVWLLPLLQLFWNHHTFERGQRAGSSPLQLAGVADAPTLLDVLEQLVAPSVAAEPA